MNAQVNLGEFEPIPILIGNEFATGPNSYSVAFSPQLGNGQLFAAVANRVNATVSVFSVDINTGAFNAINQPPVPTGNGPISVAFSPQLDNGQLFAAVANSATTTISIYTVDVNSGVFSPPTTVNAGTGPSSVAFSPQLNNGQLFAAVANGNSSNVSVYTVDINSGAFSSQTTFATGVAPTSVAFSPQLENGQLFAAVTNTNSGTVSVYTVNINTGFFVPTSPASFPTDINPISVAFSPQLENGELLAAVANFASTSVSVYRVNTSSGFFNPVIPPRTSTGQNPTSVAFSPQLENGQLFAAVSNATSNNVFVYQVLLPPILATISPIEGDFNGDTPVRITGANFTPTATVNFGSEPANGVIFISATELIAFSPPGSGVVDITVSTKLGTTTANQFTYTSIPIVTTITPNSGSSDGGTLVSIIGANFTPNATVNFGDVPVTAFFISPTLLVAFSPPGNGTVNVIVNTEVGTSSPSAANQFTYFTAESPVVTRVFPNSGPAEGGTLVSIIGANFTPNATVNFGSLPALSVSFLSSTALIAVTPSGFGIVDVTVTNELGTSALTAFGRFTYQNLSDGPGIPKNVQGFQLKNQFATQTDIMNVITWQVPSTGNPPITYKIFKDIHLTQLIGIVNANKQQKLFKFKIHNRKSDRAYTYYIVAINENGLQSSAVEVNIENKNYFR